MKTRLLVIGCLLVIVAALITVPVSAAGPTTAITGNPSSYISISLNENAVGLGSTPGVLVPNQANTNTTLNATVTANNGFTIMVKDLNVNSSYGYMRPYNFTTGYDASNTTTLADPLGVAATNPGTHAYGSLGSAYGYNASTSTPIQPLAQTTGSELFHAYLANAFNAQNLPVTFTQQVQYYDPVLASFETYRMDLEFDIGAT